MAMSLMEPTPYRLDDRDTLAYELLGPSAAPEGKTLNLALQGGGAHGAFTWGVIDALLEDTQLDFEGVSGSSAGAMNAVVMADGWAKGGRDGARAALRTFWTEIGQLAPVGLMTQGSGEEISLSPTGRMLTTWAAQFSPLQLNPMALNAMRDLLVQLVDFEALRQRSPFKLFIGATRANTGRLRVFRESEITVDVLLASACLPRIHHPVEIDGEPYWDGGYSANPAVFPLFYDCDAPDVLLVLLSPLHREETPQTRERIQERIVELGFNSSFMREMQTFSRASAFADPAFATRGRLEHKLQTMRFHMIEPGQPVSMQRAETQLLAHTPYLELLHAQGRERTAAWLGEHAAAVGTHSSIDVARCFD
jgi:NTE family protein